MPPRRGATPLLSNTVWNRRERLTQEPRKNQEKFLFRLIRDNQKTAFGQDHRFSEIRTIADYRKQVPVGDYEQLRPYIDRARHGASSMLTVDPIVMFTMTSGSTGQPKLIPVTKAMQTIHTNLTRLWYERAFLDHPRCIEGKIFGLVSQAVEGLTPGGIPYGAASGLIYRSSPRWIKRTHALPYEISEIKDFQAKYYVAMRLAIEQNVTFLGTPNPSTILRLVETADRSVKEIIKDIHDGTLSSRVDIAAKIRAALSSGLSANRERAQQLENFFHAHDKLRPQEYWPDLQLIGCWKGGSVGIRLKEFDAWFGHSVAVRDLGYLASEAQMSLPISDDGSEGILAIDANFYEFITESEIDNVNPITLTCDELEVGGIYYPVLTTAGGLYRYDINDLVRVTGFHHKTPLIEFLRKGRDVTSLTGEKVYVNQIIQAMNDAQRNTGISVAYYRAVADVHQSRYRFMVELDGKSPSMEQLQRLLRAMDRELHRLNIEYAQKRESRRLAAPLLHIMKPGWFERSNQASLRQGARDIQFKARLLTDRLEDENEILLTLENRMEIDDPRE